MHSCYKASTYTLEGILSHAAILAHIFDSGHRNYYVMASQSFTGIFLCSVMALPKATGMLCSAYSAIIYEGAGLNTT